ncbi:MAG: hypothetical protein EBR01_13305 [Proteobacteria bacterium]|nr:hypothetical protein [Pseudomonadota bacterium]
MFSGKAYKRTVYKVNKLGIGKTFESQSKGLNRARKNAFLKKSSSRLERLKRKKGFQNSLMTFWDDFHKLNPRAPKRVAIELLSNKHQIYKYHLEKALKKLFFISLNSELFQNSNYLGSHFFECNIWERIFVPFFKAQPSLSVIKNDFKKILRGSFFLASQGGFSKNVLDNESGVQEANAGDAAQFLFLGRAILAGLNCSNVDVRSSKYDAIIDQNGCLKRLQIKGLEGGSASFFTRTRGGQGVDSDHERNRPKRVTKRDCDFFIVVNKSNAVCYNIPISFIEKLPERKARSCPLVELERYKEDWSF